MKKYLIEGGKKLSGKVEIESAKNSILALLAGSILTDEEVVIKNCPKINDVLSMIDILSFLGVKCSFNENSLIINAKERKGFCVPENLTKKLRSSTYLMGALLASQGLSKIFFPGGCNIGERPIDIHIDAFKRLGVSVNVEKSFVECKRNNVSGGRVIFSFPSFGATVNVILYSVIGRGKTIIHNCAKEPEIVDLSNFLNSMGAKIKGAGTGRIEIDGVNKLHGIEYKPIADRIEVGTFLLSCAITGGDIEIHNANLQNIQLLTHKISNTSCKIDIKNDIIYANYCGVRESFNVETGPFPAFPTDMQPQTLAYLTVCKGNSFVKEKLFEKRFTQVDDLKKMGADLLVVDNCAFVRGVDKLKGCEVNANDLRGGASLVLASLFADGESLINGVEHVERGYLNFDKKLLHLGARIKTLG